MFVPRACAPLFSFSFGTSFTPMTEESIDETKIKVADGLFYFYGLVYYHEI